MSFDLKKGEVYDNIKGSQSLWNRAMSFDVEQLLNDLLMPEVSIPLEQGNVFRH